MLPFSGLNCLADVMKNNFNKPISIGLGVLAVYSIVVAISVIIYGNMMEKYGVLGSFLLLWIWCIAGVFLFLLGSSLGFFLLQSYLPAQCRISNRFGFISGLIFGLFTLVALMSFDWNFAFFGLGPVWWHVAGGVFTTLSQCAVRLALDIAAGDSES